VHLGSTVIVLVSFLTSKLHTKEDSVSTIPYVIKMKWYITKILNVAHLFHWNIIFWCNLKDLDISFPSLRKFKNSVLVGTRHFQFTTIHKQPFPFPHYCGTSDYYMLLQQHWVFAACHCYYKCCHLLRIILTTTAAICCTSLLLQVLTPI
jgi:hypothetical protein